MKGTTLHDMQAGGEFEPLDEDQIVMEQRLFIESLQGVTTRVVSDHILNLLQELEGRLPGDRDRMLGIIDRYLAMSGEDKANFQVGRRAGVYNSMDDMRHPAKYGYVGGLLKDAGGAAGLKKHLEKVRRRFV